MFIIKAIRHFIILCLVYTLLVFSQINIKVAHNVKENLTLRWTLYNARTKCVVQKDMCHTQIHSTLVYKLNPKKNYNYYLAFKTFE